MSNALQKTQLKDERTNQYLAEITASTDLAYVQSNGQWNWSLIRARYVEGWPTENNDGREWLGLKEVAQRIGMPEGSIKNRSSDERWSLLREVFQKNFLHERQTKRLKVLANRAVDFDDKGYSVADMGYDIIRTRFVEIADEHRKLKPLRDKVIARKLNGEDVKREEMRSHINYAEMQALAMAGQAFQEMGMRALGTDKDRIEISGPGGTPIQVDNGSYQDEFKRDDEARLAAFMAAGANAQFFKAQLRSDLKEEQEEYSRAQPPDMDIHEAEIVE